MDDDFERRFPKWRDGVETSTLLTSAERTGIRPARFYGKSHDVLVQNKEPDTRRPAERDHDRIQHSSALRRLNGISQIASADHIEPFHNRLVHTMKVAQVGKRIAQFILRDKEQKPIAKLVGINPEVVEAACLAHDLGHPPFGHVGERTLDKEVKDAGDPEGYEGNAQSFRILNRLALRRSGQEGLNLSRAVLAAVIKYPWSHRDAVRKKSGKFGWYASENDFARFALWSPEVAHGKPAAKSIEAAIMDHADDITYSVHDIEDFHRVRAVPWQIIRIDENGKPSESLHDLIKAAEENWHSRPANMSETDENSLAYERLLEASKRVLEEMRKNQEFKVLLDEPYEGTDKQRAALRSWTSFFINRYVTNSQYKPRLMIGGKGYPFLHIPDIAADEIRILKQVTRTFVIDRSILGAQYQGQRKVISTLYQHLLGDVKAAREDGRKLSIMPIRFQHLVEKPISEVNNARLVADCIATMTEKEAVALYKRLEGFEIGSIVDPIVR